MNGTIHSGLHRGCRASCEGLIFLGANIGNMTQAALKSSVEGGAIGIVYCKFPIVYFVEVSNFIFAGWKPAVPFAMVSEAKLRSVSGENLNPQVKKRLAAVIGIPGSCVRGRTGAVFLRRSSDGVNFYEVTH